MTKLRKIFRLTAIMLLVAAAAWGQPDFTERIIDTTAENITGLYAADIDGDLDIDLVTCNNAENQVTFWRNDGGYPINWTRILVDSELEKPLYAYAADVDGDGRVDIIAGSGYTERVAWWHNEGGDFRTWTRQIIDSTFTWIHGIGAADLNGDGFTDILGSSEGLSQIAWWQNDGNYPVTWTRHIVDFYFYKTQTIMAADINGDGRQDIVAAALNGNEVAWWRNNGGEPVTWTKYTISTNVSWPHWVYVCDMDGDGDKDVLAACYLSGEIAWWQNNGGTPIAWSKKVVGSNFYYVLTLHAADFDNDSDIDVVAMSSEAVAWWRNDGGNPTAWSRHDLNPNYPEGWPVTAADLDNDGDIDIIGAADNLKGGSSAPFTYWENRLISHIDFEADTTWGWLPLTVNFAGTSTDAITGWHWNFGDGGLSEQQSPSHLFDHPGIHDITLTADAADTSYSYTRHKYIWIIADTIKPDDTHGGAGARVEVMVNFTNNVPVQSMIIPIEYSGAMDMAFDSFSKSGCRTEHFEDSSIILHNESANQVLIRLDKHNRALPDLAPGTGPIVKLYFTIPSGATAGATASIVTDGFGSNQPLFTSSGFAYTPKTIVSTVVTDGICGDVNSNGLVNIQDITFLINFLYRDGLAPKSLVAADVNGNGPVNIQDITYLINFLYRSGPALKCRT